MQQYVPCLFLARGVNLLENTLSTNWVLTSESGVSFYSHCPWDPEEAGGQGYNGFQTAQTLTVPVQLLKTPDMSPFLSPLGKDSRARAGLPPAHCVE